MKKRIRIREAASLDYIDDFDGDKVGQVDFTIGKNVTFSVDFSDTGIRVRGNGSGTGSLIVKPGGSNAIDVELDPSNNVVPWEPLAYGHRVLILDDPQEVGTVGGRDGQIVHVMVDRPGKTKGSKTIARRSVHASAVIDQDFTAEPEVGEGKPEGREGGV